MVLFVISTFRKNLKTIMMNTVISIPCTCFGKVVYQQRQRPHKVADSFSHGFSQTL